MFRLIKFGIFLVLLAGFVGFAWFVPLGSKTLFGHLGAISKSKESGELVRGLEQATAPLVEKVKAVAGHAGDGGATGDAASAADRAAPADDLSRADRKRLRRLLAGAADGGVGGRTGRR